VSGEVRRPDGSGATVTLAEGADGQFAAQFATTLPGVYRFRLRARGTTMGGEPFTREKTLTAAVWRGGDRPADPGSGQLLVDYLRERDARLCELLGCLAGRGGLITAELERRLQTEGLDLESFRKCLHLFCGKPEDGGRTRDD
jgi:hypothetical protein